MTGRFAEALAYAERLHRDQRRKSSGVPYVSHLLAVAALVMETGGDEDECIAALLHDAVEDQGGEATAEEIRRRYGERVGAIVDGCTEHSPAGSGWRERKQAAVAAAARAGPSVRLVLCADKLHNVRSLTAEYRRKGERTWASYKGGRDGSLWYYRAMSDALAGAGAPPLAADLAEAVRVLESLVGRSGLPAS